MSYNSPPTPPCSPKIQHNPSKESTRIIEQQPNYSASSAASSTRQILSTSPTVDFNISLENLTKQNQLNHKTYHVPFSEEHFFARSPMIKQTSTNTEALIRDITNSNSNNNNNNNSRNVDRILTSSLSLGCVTNSLNHANSNTSIESISGSSSCAKSAPDHHHHLHLSKQLQLEKAKSDLSLTSAINDNYLNNQIQSNGENENSNINNNNNNHKRQNKTRVDFERGYIKISAPMVDEIIKYRRYLLILIFVLLYSFFAMGVVLMKIFQEPQTATRLTTTTATIINKNSNDNNNDDGWTQEMISGWHKDRPIILPSNLNNVIKIRECKSKAHKQNQEQQKQLIQLQKKLDNVTTSTTTTTTSKPDGAPSFKKHDKTLNSIELSKSTSTTLIPTISRSSSSTTTTTSTTSTTIKPKKRRRKFEALNGCLFRRDTKSDSLGDICCCAGVPRFVLEKVPIFKNNHTLIKNDNNYNDKSKLFNNKTFSITTNSSNLIKQIINNNSTTTTTTTSRSPETISLLSKDDANNNEFEFKKKYLRPQIMCFISGSGNLFNSQKLVAPIANEYNLKNSFVKDKGNCISCSCCHEHEPEKVNKLLANVPIYSNKHKINSLSMIGASSPTIMNTDNSNNNNPTTSISNNIHGGGGVESNDLFLQQFLTDNNPYNANSNNNNENILIGRSKGIWHNMRNSLTNLMRKLDETFYWCLDLIDLSLITARYGQISSSNKIQNYDNQSELILIQNALIRPNSFFDKSNDKIENNNLHDNILKVSTKTTVNFPTLLIDYDLYDDFTTTTTTTTSTTTTSTTTTTTTTTTSTTTTKKPTTKYSNKQKRKRKHKKRKKITTTTTTTRIPQIISLLSAIPKTIDNKNLTFLDKNEGIVLLNGTFIKTSTLSSTTTTKAPTVIINVYAGNNNNNIKNDDDAKNLKTFKNVTTNTTTNKPAIMLIKGNEKKASKEEDGKIKPLAEVGNIELRINLEGGNLTSTSTTSTTSSSSSSSTSTDSHESSMQNITTSIETSKVTRMQQEQPKTKTATILVSNPKENNQPIYEGGKIIKNNLDNNNNNSTIKERNLNVEKELLKESAEIAKIEIPTTTTKTVTSINSNNKNDNLHATLGEKLFSKITSNNPLIVSNNNNVSDNNKQTIANSFIINETKSSSELDHQPQPQPQPQQQQQQTLDQVDSMNDNDKNKNSFTKIVPTKSPKSSIVISLGQDNSTTIIATINTTKLIEKKEEEEEEEERGGVGVGVGENGSLTSIINLNSLENKSELARNSSTFMPIPSTINLTLPNSLLPKNLFEMSKSDHLQKPTTIETTTTLQTNDPAQNIKHNSNNQREQEERVPANIEGPNKIFTANSIDSDGGGDGGKLLELFNNKKLAVPLTTSEIKEAAKEKENEKVKLLPLEETRQEYQNQIRSFPFIDTINSPPPPPPTSSYSSSSILDGQKVDEIKEEEEGEKEKSNSNNLQQTMNNQTLTSIINTIEGAEKQFEVFNSNDSNIQQKLNENLNLLFMGEKTSITNSSI